MDRISAERLNAAPSTLFEAIAGVGAIVIAILGLTHILPRYMAALGTIVVGAALVEGAALAPRARDARRALHGRASAALLAGGAGVVLGVLALLGVSELVVLPVAVIVFGTSLLIAGFSARRPARLGGASTVEGAIVIDPSTGAVDPSAAYVEPADTVEPGEAASGAQLLVGLAAVVLGILALLGNSPLVLTLIALLCVGCTELLSGAVLS